MEKIHNPCGQKYNSMRRKKPLAEKSLHPPLGTDFPQLPQAGLRNSRPVTTAAEMT